MDFDEDEMSEMPQTDAEDPEERQQVEGEEEVKGDEDEQ